MNKNLQAFLHAVESQQEGTSPDLQNLKDLAAQVRGDLTAATQACDFGCLTNNTGCGPVSGAGTVGLEPSEPLEPGLDPSEPIRP